MINFKDRTQRQQYYFQAWQNVFGHVETLLLENEFSTKPTNGKGKFEIGNEHGEVYADPANRDGDLYQLRIAPTATGKLSIKLTYNSRKARDTIKSKIKKEILVGPPETTTEGKYAITYLFLDKPLSDYTEDADKILIDKTKLWLELIAC